MMENKTYWLPLLFMVAITGCTSTKQQNDHSNSNVQKIILETDIEKTLTMPWHST